MPPTVIIMPDLDTVEQSETSERGFGALMTDQGPLPLRSLEVLARLEGLFVQTEVVQTFANVHATALEATYIFPLPDRAAVTSFRLEVAGRVIEGLVKERGGARADYTAAIRAGHRAAIAEEERPGVFTVRVGNLPPGETAVVRLSLVGPLLYDSGEVTYRFPLVVSPRYIPGKPLAGLQSGSGIAPDTDQVPDASRISPPVLLPGYPYPVRFSLKAEIAKGSAIRGQIRSSLHAISQTDSGDCLSLQVQPGERLNRDFVLRYTVGEDALQAGLVLVPDAKSEAQEGTFLLTVQPPVLASANGGAVRPRDVVFVIDRSGSMAGWKMVAARRALGRMVDALTEHDRFAVLPFDDVVETPPLGEGLLQASDRVRYRAIEWLSGIDARGGTEMAEPLAQAAGLLVGDRDRVLVLITDGQVGNEDQILALLAPRLRGTRIFTLGIDRAVNEAFLKRLAALGGGLCDIVESEERLDEIMVKVQRRLAVPLLTDLTIQTRGLEIVVDSLTPDRLPDLFPGVPVQVLGRYRGQAGSLSLQATDGAGGRFSRELAGELACQSGLATIWARGRLRDLEDRWVTAGHESPAELQRQMVAISERFGVLCRFTAYVAVDHAAVVNEGGRLQQMVQPVELPSGWEDFELECAEESFNCVADVRSLEDADEFRSVRRGFPRTPPAASPANNARSAMPNQKWLAPASAKAQAATPVPAQKSFWKRLGERLLPASLTGGVGGASGAKLDGAAVTDLAAYRQRAGEILKELRVPGDLPRRLGRLRLRLQDLVDDLASTGAPASQLEPLLELLRALGELVRADLAELEAHAERVLTAFSGVTA